MTIHTEQTLQATNGFKKRINASAMDLMLNVMQKSQYNFPVRSTIREVTSNALDSIIERDIAKDILSGRKTVEECFVVRDGELYDRALTTKQYFVHSSFVGVNKNIYHSSEYAALTDAEYAGIIEEVVKATEAKTEALFKEANEAQALATI